MRWRSFFRRHRQSLAELQMQGAKKLSIYMHICKQNRLTAFFSSAFIPRAAGRLQPGTPLAATHSQAEEKFQTLSLTNALTLFEIHIFIRHSVSPIHFPPKEIE